VKKSYDRPISISMAVTVIALSFSLAEPVVAGTDTMARQISTAKVKRIAKTVVNQEINRRVPGLSVGSAVSAQSANTANTANTANFANSANPVLFARVAANGGVFTANSKGVSSANVASPLPGVYCFSGLPGIKGGQVTLDIFDTVDDEVGQFGLGDILVCPVEAQFVVVTFSQSGGFLVPTAFFLHLYQ